MNMPFCELCPISSRCLPDLRYFKNATGNKRIPPESFCKEQFKKFNIEYNDFYKKVLILNSSNVYPLIALYPELRDDILEMLKNKEIESLPTQVTLMLTEKCNLKCKYCYEVFSGNMKAESMPIDVAKKSIDFFFEEIRQGSCVDITWDFIGGEVFVEFELLKQTIDYLIQKYRQNGICTKKYLNIGLGTNLTILNDDIKKWCEEIRSQVHVFGISISLDGPKHVHDINRCGSFDRVMENFDWWRKTFPDCTIKGTVNPYTIKHLYESVLFFVEDLKLPQFYINPTFEGPWNEELAIEYSEQLIRIAEYFIDHPEYDVLNNSNILFNTDFKRRPKNWCGSGIYMRAVTPNGDIYPCLRAATSRVHKIGNIHTDINTDKIIPFYFYTIRNETTECNNCKWLGMCPSCVIEWIENTGDMFKRSTKSCLMTKARLIVSEHFCKFINENKAKNDGSWNTNNMDG